MKDRLKMFVSTLVLAASTLAGWLIFAQSGDPDLTAAEAVARDAVSADDTVAREARARLRAMGPAGLEVLFSVQAPEVARLLKGLPEGEKAPASWARLRGALDAVARQRDAHASRLYWYTDMKAATDAARALHRPILSLRLLGNLDDELSCANSRYFRTALYANRAIADRLRAGWILHWETVRPAPLMTIDYGDGRRIERTVTGNSLHYVLDADEHVLDVLPGLLGPGMFFREIGKDEELARSAGSLPASERDRLVAQFHRARLVDVERRWREDLEAWGGPRTPETSAAELPEDASIETVEARLKTYADQSDGGVWDRLAARHADDAALDANSIGLMRLKTHGVYSESSFARVVSKFEAASARDGLRNAYALRPTIDAWLAEPRMPVLTHHALAEKIYDEVFLTPRRDPWLGLVPAETYSAIEGDGRITTDAAGARRTIDGVPLPTDEEILRLGPPPTAFQAGERAGMKTLLERPSIKQIASPSSTPGGAPAPHVAEDRSRG